MQASHPSAPGGTDPLTVDAVPVPEPAGDERLGRVHAVGGNPLDRPIWHDGLPAVRDDPRPWLPGRDVSGIVGSVGASVAEVDPGDAGYGVVRLPGAGATVAESATMQADEGCSRPASRAHVQAAGVPMAGQTALHAG